jgi:DNA-binding NarL/FixJ family response regulator
MSNGILVVDDNANIRHLLRVFVESKGFQVCGEAENGADAVKKAKHLKPDLVLLDLSMPIMTGSEAAPILKRMMPQVKIILFTMHADGMNKSMPSALNVDVVIAKSDSIKKLGEHLKALLAPPNDSQTENTPTSDAHAEPS